MYGYIYKTTNLINKKIYIGQKKSDKYLGNKYLGSGKLIVYALQKYGKSNFSVELLQECYSLNELNDAEMYWINKFNSTDKKIGYNITLGGGGTSGFHLSEESKKKIQITRATTEFKQKMQEIYSSDEYKMKVSHKGKDNPMYGKTHSEEAKEKIRAATSVKRSQEFKDNRRNVMLGTKWYNNGKKSIQIKEDDVIPDGYTPGRASIKRTKKKEFIGPPTKVKFYKNWARNMRKQYPNKQKRRYTDGDICIVSPICPEGFWHDSINIFKNKTQEEKDIIIEKQRTSIKNYYKEHPEVAKTRSKNYTGKGNPRYGKPVTQKQREKISQANRGRRRMTNSQIFPKYKNIKSSEINDYLNKGWCFYENFNIY